MTGSQIVVLVVGCCSLAACLNCLRLVIRRVMELRASGLAGSGGWTQSAAAAMSLGLNAFLAVVTAVWLYRCILFFL